MSLSNVPNKAANQPMDSVRYDKTEHGYNVEVEVVFRANGKSEFYERDCFDLRGYLFDPSPREQQFADFLRRQPPQSPPVHLDLDDQTSLEVVLAWIDEPCLVSQGMEKLNRALHKISLSEIDGEYFLAKVTRAVEAGRILAREASASTRRLSRMLSRLSLADRLIARWLRRVDLLVAAIDLRRLPPSSKRDDAA